jgi:hypothetical protein
MGYISQTQHKPSARAKETLNYQNSTRMRPYIRVVAPMRSSLERSNTPYGTLAVHISSKCPKNNKHK